jgi:CRP-like cAMP-binding protein
MAIDIEILKKINYFDGLDSAELKFIKDRIIEKTLDKGEVLLIEGGTSRYLYFVVSGLVKIYKSSPNGKEQILHVAPPGDSLNDVPIFGGKPRNTASVAAMTPVILYAIPSEDLKIILHDPPKIVLNILKSLANRIGRDAKLVKELSSTQATAKLAKLLLGKYAGEEATVGSVLTQGDMANMIGVSRENVNRALKDMEKRGAIRLNRHRVAVVSKKILNEIAKDIKDTPA